MYGSEGTTKPQKTPRPVEDKLEENIIDDIPVNFLFARGTDLRSNLIDIERAFRIVKKIDEGEGTSMAKAARELDDEARSQVTSNVEPPPDAPSPAAKWSSVVHFMRANPKILMQIIPDSVVSGGSPKSASKQRGGGRVSKL